MPVTIHFTINGSPKELVAEPHLRLLDVIREVANLTGTKEGCGTGDCGACTVILNGRAVTSCCTLATEAEGAEIITIEGISEAGHLHPVQEQFIAQGGLQCGFCTPGFIVATKALLDENPDPTVDEIKVALAGNLCRCTGYGKIIEAVQAAASDLRTREEAKV